MPIGAIKNSYVGNKKQIVREGLILNLDAGDYDSYSGGSTWYDLSGNGNDFTMYGTLSFTNNGTNSYFTSTATTSNYFVLYPFAHPITTTTVEMWADSTNAAGRALYSYNASGAENNNLLFNTSNLSLYGPWGNVATSQNITTGGWKHLMRTSNRTTGKEILYINGAEVYNGTLGATTNYTTNGAMVLGQEQDGLWVRPGTGGFNASQAFVGHYSVFRMYDRVLNATEVKQNYDAIRGRYE